MKSAIPGRIVCGLVAASILVFMLSATAGAENSRFREDFTKSYRAGRISALVYLVKANKETIPAEVRGIMDEALAPGTPYAEKMDLLDLASAMASMYREASNDPSLADEVLGVQRREIDKENARLAELKKWDKYELVTGNIVMKGSEAAMAEAGLTPVIFPHWTHRLYYDCKACHPGVFRPERGGNGIDMAAIYAAEKCGVCHDGKTAFGAEKDCARCHAAGRPGAERLMDPGKLDLKAVGETATRLGGAWRPERLADKTLPLDRFNSIDWTRLARSMVRRAAPGPAAAESGTVKRHGSKILFEPRMDFIKNVVFDHGTHTEQSACSSCHPAPFKAELGANPVSMREMGSGKHCGACHGKVAFRFAECNRCHSIDKTGPGPAGVLTRGARPRR